MQLSIELSDRDIERIAEAVAARVGRSSATPMLVGPVDVGVSRRVWRAAIKDKSLAAFKVGRELLAHRADVEKWLATLKVSTCSPPEITDLGEAPDELDQLLEAGRWRSIRGGRS